jgi:hypothetical protein
MASKETTTADHRCTICGRTFETAEALDDHVKDICGDW